MTTAVFIKPLWTLIAVCVVGIILFAYLSYKSKLNDGNDGIPPSPKDLGILPTII